MEAERPSSALHAPTLEIGQALVSAGLGIGEITDRGMCRLNGDAFLPAGPVQACARAAPGSPTWERSHTLQTYGMSGGSTPARWSSARGGAHALRYRHADLVDCGS